MHEEPTSYPYEPTQAIPANPYEATSPYDVLSIQPPPPKKRYWKKIMLVIACVVLLAGVPVKLH